MVEFSGWSRPQLGKLLLGVQSTADFLDVAFFCHWRCLTSLQHRRQSGSPCAIRHDTDPGVSRLLPPLCWRFAAPPHLSHGPLAEPVSSCIAALFAFGPMFDLKLSGSTA
jgi:hypothetical protein